MAITEILNQIQTTLNHQENHLIFMAVYLALVLLTIILRIISHLHFRTALIAFQLEARKNLTDRKEIASLKNGLLRKAAAEYIRVAERAVTSVPTKQLVDRTISNMSLLGWRYENILPFVESIDTGLLWVGIVLAVIFPENAFMYGTLAVAAFLIIRIFTAFFNARGAKAQLSDELTLYIEREIGRFFASDSGGAIIRLKNELTEAINKQSQTYKETMESISHSMTAALTTVAKSMANTAESIGPIVATAMDEKLVNMNDSLQSTLSDWKNALTDTAKTHNALNEAAERLAHSSNRIQSAAELLATHMKGHSNTLSDQIIALVSAVDATKEGLDNLATQQQSLAKQAQYIEINQHTLENSLVAYEASLQNLTQSLGDGLGAFINIHAQSAAQSVNDALKSNLDRIINLSQRSEN